MASTRGAYRGVYCSLVDSLDFQRLSPHAKLVFLTVRLSTQAGPACIFRFYPAVLADQTGLPVTTIKAAVRELAVSGWIQYEDGIMWLVNALKYDPTMRLSHPKQRIAVERCVEALPFRPIVARFCQYYSLERLSQRLTDTFTTDLRLNAPIVPYPDTDTDTDTDTETETDSAPRSAGAVRGAWEAYSGSYKRRYGVLPVRNGKVNGQLALLAKRLPESDVAAVAGFYVQHNGARYVAAAHPVGLLLYDAEKLHMEWSTGRKVTETGARVADQRQERGGVAERLLAKAHQEEIPQ